MRALTEVFSHPIAGVLLPILCRSTNCIYQLTGLAELTGFLLSQSESIDSFCQGGLLLYSPSAGITDGGG